MLPCYTVCVQRHVDTTSERDTMSNITPSQNLIRNIKLFMTWRSLRHPDVARAMNTIGFPWHRKTVYRVLGGERPVHMDELYGLALVFETTVSGLLDPATAEPKVSKEAFTISAPTVSASPLR